MAEQAEGTKTINASPSEIMEVIKDFDSYPEWTDVKKIEVVNRDDEARPTEVAYEVDLPMLGTAKYTLAYTYEEDDAGCSWTTKSVQEGPLRDIEGEYVLEELDEDETEVTYRISADITARVPGFLKKQGQKQVIRNALDGLKKRVEQG